MPPEELPPRSLLPAVFSDGRHELQYELRGRQTRLKLNAGQLGPWARALGECADPGCYCNRLQQPRTRERFRQLLLSCSARREAVRPLRYVSVGSGGLLADLELIACLEAQERLRP